MRLCLLFAFCVLVSGCQPGSTPYDIGHIASFTGADKDAAEQEANGIRLALDDYATASPPPARPIRVRHVDGKGDLTSIEGQAVRLATINRAQILLGGIDAVEVNRLERSGAIVISPIGQRSSIMSERVTVTGLSPTQRGKALATYLHETIKPANIALLVEPSDDSNATEAAFLAAWTEAKHPAPAKHELGDPASDVVKKWIEALPKETLPVVIASPAAFKTLALETPLRDRPLAYAGPEILRQPLKERTAPIYLVTAFNGQGKAAEFAKRYEAKFGVPAEPHAALAYDDARFAFDSLKKNPLLLPRVRDEPVTVKEFVALSGPTKIAAGVLDRPTFAGTLKNGIFENP